MRTINISGVLVLVFFFSCSGGQKNVEGDIGAITTQMQAHVQAAMTGNADRYVEFVSEETIYMPPGEAILVGKEAIREWVKAGFEMASFEIILYPFDEIEVAGDWAYARYRVTLNGKMKSDASEFSEERKYLDIWKKADDQWMLHRHMWSGNP